ncbi:MAG: transposase [Deltaproteobacteria bacterium]|nr:transposase [Deltaproteobacteria bacterium]
MSRPLRIQYPGAVYHVTCRGNERRDIFRDDSDRRAFLEILAESQAIYQVKLYAAVLMGNHFHLLLETPLGNLNEFMRRFNITYTGYFNRRHLRVGHLYQGRYKSILVEKETYLSELSRYIHLNPVRTQVLEKADVRVRWPYLLDYRWSTLPGYLKLGDRWPGVDYGLVLGEFKGDNPKGRHAYGKRIREDLVGGIELKGKIVGGCVLGRPGYIQWVRERYLKELAEGEYSGYKTLKRYRSREQVLDSLAGETGLRLEEVKAVKGDQRRLVIELLYRVGGLKGAEIGSLFGIGASAVSQERKRLNTRMAEEEAVKNQFEALLSKCLT